MATLAFAPKVADASAAVPQSDADREVERLRLLIERQPTCLMRVGLDGVILAANDAALGQLGASQLGEALGHPFSQWMVPNQRERWWDLAKHVRENGAASVECDIVDLAGRQHALQLQAVKQPGHPDGVESMVVAVREISSLNRLEQALQDHEAASRALADAKERLEAHAKARAADAEERLRLEQMLEETRAERARLEGQVAALSAEAEKRTRLERALEDARAEKTRLEALANALAAELEEHRARAGEERAKADEERTQVEQALDQARAGQAQLEAQVGALTADAQKRAVVAEALERALAERTRLETLANALAAELEDERAQVGAALEKALAEKAQLDAKLSDQETRLVEMEAERRRQQARYAEESAQLDTLLAGAVRSVTMARQLVKGDPERPSAAGRVTE